MPSHEHQTTNLIFFRFLRCQNCLMPVKPVTSWPGETRHASERKQASAESMEFFQKDLLKLEFQEPLFTQSPRAFRYLFTIYSSFLGPSHVQLNPYLFLISIRRNSPRFHRKHKLTWTWPWMDVSFTKLLHIVNQVTLFLYFIHGVIKWTSTQLSLSNPRFGS